LNSCIPEVFAEERREVLREERQEVFPEERPKALQEGRHLVFEEERMEKASGNKNN
jgi:hypothetical protein